MAGYGNILQQLAGGAPPNAMGMGLGKPPTMPNAPPPPTGIGAMATGDPGTAKKAAGDDAISSLRALQAAAPNLKMAIDGMIDAIKSGISAPDAGGGAPPPDVPAPPGAPMPDMPSTTGPGNGSPGL
jgi:hypothetical protein